MTCEGFGMHAFELIQNQDASVTMANSPRLSPKPPSPMKELKISPVMSDQHMLPPLSEQKHIRVRQPAVTGADNRCRMVPQCSQVIGYSDGNVLIEEKCRHQAALLRRSQASIAARCC